MAKHYRAPMSEMEKRRKELTAKIREDRRVNQQLKVKKLAEDFKRVMTELDALNTPEERAENERKAKHARYNDIIDQALKLAKMLQAESFITMASDAQGIADKIAALKLEIK